MINDLIEALAKGPIVDVDGYNVCAHCKAYSLLPVPDFVHRVDCPVNQARLMLSNLQDVAGDDEGHRSSPSPSLDASEAP